MSYIRGDMYVFESTEGLNIWSTEDFKPENDRHQSGVIIPMETFDELVMMRYYQMHTDEREAAEKRARQKYAGNVGCYELNWKTKPISEWIKEFWNKLRKKG